MDNVNDEAEMSFVDHLEVLRWHIIRSVLAITIAAIFVFIYVREIVDNFILAPTKNSFISYNLFCKLGNKIGLKDGLCVKPFKVDFVQNTVTGPITAAFSIALWGGFLICFPYIIWELWRFVKPALTQKEIKYAQGSLFWVSICFLLGAAFGYFILCPFSVNFLANFQLSENIKLLPSFTDYIDFITTIIIACGVAFEMPVFGLVLAKIGILSAQTLRNVRKYAIVIIMIAAAIITPSPDISSMLIVFLPLQGLYEITILLVAKEDKKRQKEFPDWE